MHRYKCAFLSLALAFAGVAAAQTTPTTTDNGPKTLSAAGIEFGGLVDGYYSANFNHPASKVNTWRNFDIKANSFALNFAKLTLTHKAEPVGFTLDLAAGRAMDIFHPIEPAGSELYKHLLQAFVSVRPTNMNGFQRDFGKFVTGSGSQVTETHLSWNYSRSLLYASVPYYHYGARTTVPVTGNFSAGFQLINGWNNVEDNNSSKTMGFTTALTTSKFTWNNNYYVGNEKNDTVGGVKIKAPGLRHFYDLVLGFNPSGKVSGLFNFDYGLEKN